MLFPDRRSSSIRAGLDYSPGYRASCGSLITWKFFIMCLRISVTITISAWRQKVLFLSLLLETIIKSTERKVLKSVWTGISSAYVKKKKNHKQKQWCLLKKFLNITQSAVVGETTELYSLRTDSYWNCPIGDRLQTAVYKCKKNQTLGSDTFNQGMSFDKASNFINVYRSLATEWQKR